MGACSVEFKVREGSREEVKKAFEQRRASDRDEYGWDPYSGTWATIEGSLGFAKKEFETLEAAQD